MGAQIRHNKTNGGFTLIEVMITFAVLSIGLLALASMQTTAIRDNTFSSGLTEPSALAQHKMEEFMLHQYDDSLFDDTDNDGTDQDLDNDGVDDDNGDVDKTDDDFGLWHDTVATADHNENKGDYNLFWNVAIDEPMLLTNKKTIRIIVTWNGQERKIHIDFIKFDND